jgi:ribose transport system substrate-binding protein
MHRRWSVLLALLGLLLAAAGCGSSGGSSGGASSSNAANAGGGSGGGGGAAAATLQTLYKGEGYKAPPATSPPPAKGKSVWVFSCSQSAQGCSVPAGAAVEAAKLMGWHVTLYDTQLSPSRIEAGVRSAIAAKADGIIQYSLDCPFWPSAIRLAHNAGIKIVAAEALQCTAAGQPRLDAIVDYTQGAFTPPWFREYGRAQAVNVIAKKNGSAKIIYVHQTDVASFRYLAAGVKSEVQSCSGCSIVDEVDFTSGDFGSGLQQKIQEAILKHPDANAMIWDWDIGDIGAIAALRASGGAKSFVVSVALGLSQTIKAMRSGQIDGIGVGIPQEWEGYASVDDLNRLFNNQKAAPSGIGLQSFDTDHNFPSGDLWQPPIDFKAAYKKAWGVG